jgi:hypothetical protein
VLAIDEIADVLAALPARAASAAHAKASDPR